MPDPNVPDAFAVIADRVGGNGLYSSNAQVVVYKLVGDFDPKEAISHGFIDSQQLPAWRSTDASLADYGGMPSSLIEGTYRENSMTLNTSRRHVIATSGPDRYLVSLAVTTSVDQAVAAADATDAIVKGFKVSAPGRRPAPPPPRRARRRRPASPRQLGAQVALPAPAELPGTAGISRRPPGEAWRPGDAPRDAAASYCVAHADRRGAVSVRRGRDRRRRPVAADPAPAGDYVRQVLRAVGADPAGRRRDAGRRRSGGAVRPTRRPACSW